MIRAFGAFSHKIHRVAISMTSIWLSKHAQAFYYFTIGQVAHLAKLRVSCYRFWRIFMYFLLLMSVLSQLRHWLLRTPLLLRMLLAAYVVMAMGVLTWTPALWFQTDAQHQVYLTDRGHSVSWVSHHVEADEQSHSATAAWQHEHDAAQPHQTPDHVLDVPSLDQPLTAQKYFTVSDFGLLPILLTLLLAFLALYRYQIPQKIGRVRHATTPLRNSISRLTRTVVLRH